MSSLWLPGDIGVTTGSGVVERLIQTGERLHGDAFWKWNHAFIVVGPSGETVEALARGVVRSNVANHGEQLNLGCPAEVDREKVAAFAVGRLGDSYSYLGDVLMGVDCIVHTRFHAPENVRAAFCSELAAKALVAGGWESPTLPALTMPSTLVANLQGAYLLR